MTLRELFARAVSAWESVRHVALRYRHENFGEDAETNLRFYSGPHDFVYDERLLEGTPFESPGPYHRMTANLVSNMVQVFLPTLYTRNPVRVVTPRVPDIDPNVLNEWAQMELPPEVDPQTGQLRPVTLPNLNVTSGRIRLRSALLEWYLNTTPNEYNLKREARRAIVDALIAGMGYLWCEVQPGPLGSIVGSFWVPWSDVVLDPDEVHLRSCRWVMRRRVMPARTAEEIFGWPRHSLRGRRETATRSAAVESGERTLYDRAATERGTTDQLEFWEVYSRMGIGARLASFETEAFDLAESFGQNVYLAICPDVPVPLNLPEPIFEMDEASLHEEISRRLEWPVPTHVRPNNPWPFAALWFHTRPDCVYPLAHVTPAIGYQRCIDWIYSYMMSRIRVASRTLLVTPKELDQAIKDRLLHGSDMELIEIQTRHPEVVDRLVHYVQVPDVNRDIWAVLAAVKREWELATGVTELLQAGQTPAAYRSAAEAAIKQGYAQIRPDDMATSVEEWMTCAAENEAFAAQWLLGPEDVAPIFNEQELLAAGGPTPYTSLWGSVVRSSDPREIASSLEYRIEAGSIRKPNKERQIDQANELLRTLMPVVVPYWQATGDPTQLNHIISFWSRTSEVADWQRLLFPNLAALAAAKERSSADQAEADGEAEEAVRQ